MTAVIESTVRMSDLLLQRFFLLSRFLLFDLLQLSLCTRKSDCVANNKITLNIFLGKGEKAVHVINYFVNACRRLNVFSTSYLGLNLYVIL